MKITKIEPQKKRPGRRSIFVDGEFLIGVASDTLIRFGLRTGDELTGALLKEIGHAEEILGAKAAALRSLAVRPRTEREIRDTLRDREFSDPVAAEVVAALKEAGLIDDAAFARSYIRNALTLRPAGRILLKRKLLLLGVGKVTADEALDEILGGVRQEEEAEKAATAFVAKKPRARREEGKLRQQVTAYLLRRGYSWDVVRQAVRTVLKGEPIEGEDL